MRFRGNENVMGTAIHSVTMTSSTKAADKLAAHAINTPNCLRGTVFTFTAPMSAVAADGVNPSALAPETAAASNEFCEAAVCCKMARTATPRQVMKPTNHTSRKNCAIHQGNAKRDAIFTICM